MRLEVTTPRDLEPADGAWIAAHLCRPSSEMQVEFHSRSTETPVAVIWTTEPVAWVGSHEWHGYQTLEAFTHPEWRRRGLARMGCLALLALSYVNRDDPVAVFSWDCVGLARSLGFRHVHLYERDTSGNWRRCPEVTQ